MKKRYRVGKSKIHGKGIFATVDIKEGARVFVLLGKIVHKKIETKKEAQQIINWIGLGKDIWLNTDNTIGRYVNHSCNPNTVLKGRTLHAILPIKKGDEITFDYSLTDTDPHWTITCRCGSSECRKNIGSIHSLSRAIFKSKIHYVPRFSRLEYAHKTRV